MKILRFGTAIALLSSTTAIGCTRDMGREPAMRPASRDVSSTRTAAMPRTGADNATSSYGNTPDPGPPPMSVVNTDAYQRLVVDLANARCDRAQSCNHVGDGRRFDDRTDCLEDVADDVDDELDLERCRNGLLLTQMDSCVAEVKSESCQVPYDDLDAAAGCRAASLCID